MPWIVADRAGGAITTAGGMIVGLPALRMTGIYLAIATLAFSVIIQEVFSRWESVTHGFAGMQVDKPDDLRRRRSTTTGPSTTSACSSWWSCFG